MTRRRIVPCTAHPYCTRPDGHEGACSDPLDTLDPAAELPGVVAVFSGRVCPSCGWHESGRHVGAFACFVCRAPMLSASHELRQEARVSGGRTSPFVALGVYFDAEGGTIAVVGELVGGRRMLFGPLPIRGEDV